MKYIYSAIALLLLAAVLLGGGFVAGYHMKSGADQVAQDKANKAAQAQLLKEQQNNAVLSAAKATSDAQIVALQDQITHQLPKVEKVYVYIRKPSSPTTAAPVAVTGPVYITTGLVGLYDQSLGLPGSTSASQSNDATAGLPSDFTLDDYFSTSLRNNGICLTATREVALFQSWVRGLNAGQ